jgi:WD40 repeat protein
VTTLAFSSDGAYLASGHVDGVIHVWDLESGHELKARLGHDGAVGAVAFSPDGTVIASGGADATVKLWDVNALRAGEARRRFFRQPAPVTCLAHLGEGRFLVTGHTNRVLRIQDSSTGRPKATLRGHDAPPSSLAVSPDGSLLASGARDGGILVFNVEEALKVDVPTEGRALRHESRNRSISSLAFFPDNEVLAGVAMDETLSLWSVGSGIPETLAGNPGERFASVAVFAQGQQLACGLADGRVRLWIAGD